MKPGSWAHGGEYLVQGISWTTRRPHLDLVDTSTRTRWNIPLLATRLAFTVRPGERYCVGRYVFVGAEDVRLRECADQRHAVAGGQCAECQAGDEFRFIHQVHRGGQVSRGLQSYVAQPHWVYIATFADAACKVGTAAHVRKRARLDEQGAVRATYLALAENGIAARAYEDSLTDTLGLGQAKRRSVKVAALARPRSAAEIDRAHRRAVEQAGAHLAQSFSVDLRLEPWRPPDEHAVLFTDRIEVVAEYPHPLTFGDHCLSVHALIGTAAVVSVNEDDSRYLADLGELKGRRIQPGHVHSPPTSVQMGLF